MSKQKLVVVGNGMAGARAVEEVLARGGADFFDIVIFGDEPYGNYNRIMLSNILSGQQNYDEIYINTLDWYVENVITLHAGARVNEINRYGKYVVAENGVRESYDFLLIATGSRAFMPPIPGLHMADKSLKPGVFGFRTIDDTIGMVAAATGGMVAAAPGKRAVVIGGGLLGLEAAGAADAWLRRDGGASRPPSDGPAARYDGRRDVAGRDGEDGRQGVAGDVDDRGAGRRARRGADLQGWQHGRADLQGWQHGRVRSAGGRGRIRPNWEIGTRAGLTVERAIVVDNYMRSVDEMTVYVVGECAQHRGIIYGLVAPLWDQCKVFADNITKRNVETQYFGSKLATKSKVMGVELASMGITEPKEEHDEVIQFQEPKKGTYKKLIVRDGRLVGGILLGDISKAAFLMQAFDRESPLPDERLSLMFDLGAPSQKVTIDEMPADAQVCNCKGITKQTIGGAVETGARTLPAVMNATRAGKGCGSCKGLIGEVIAWFAGGAIEEDPSIHYYVPCIPMKKQALIAAIREHDLHSVSSVFRVLAGGVEDPASKIPLASLLNTIWPGQYDDQRDARFINDRVHGNIQKDGTFSVVPEMAGGVCSPAELMRIASAAVKYDVPLVKLTGGQRIDLVGVKKEDLPGIWADIGMPAGHAWGKSYRTCKSCIGTDHCRFGLGDSMALAIRIEKTFRALSDSPGKLKLATAGCPRNCSEALVKDIGVVAIGEDRWEVLVGGAAGSSVRKGDLLCTVTGEDEVMAITGRFIQFYREDAKYKERTHTWVERIGLERIQAVVVEDCEGWGERFDAEIAAAVKAYRDPWKDGAEPKTENQFRSLIPVEA